MKQVVLIAVAIAIVVLGVWAANMPKSKYAEVIDDHEEVGKYLIALTSSQLPLVELEHIQLNQKKKSEWISGDQAFLASHIDDRVVTMFDNTFLTVFDNALVTCGTLRFGVGQEPLRNFIAARRSSVGLVQGDIHLDRHDFALLYDLVCHNKPYLN